MKNGITLFLFLLFTGICRDTSAQQYLPYFSATGLSEGNIKISWNNPFNTCVQLAVQRSSDSLKGFRTILSAQSPALPENGFVDKTAPLNGKVYYRIFYTLRGGAYFFSKTIPASTVNTPEKISYPKKHLKKKHSPQSKNRKISPYIFTDEKGYLQIALPKARVRNYRLTIYDSDNTVLFAVNRIQETEFLLEKGNFLHAGWFNFELFEDGKLLEANRFYIQKD